MTSQQFTVAHRGRPDGPYRFQLYIEDPDGKPVADWVGTAVGQFTIETGDRDRRTTLYDIPLEALKPVPPVDVIQRIEFSSISPVSWFYDADKMPGAPDRERASLAFREVGQLQVELSRTRRELDYARSQLAEAQETVRNIRALLDGGEVCTTDHEPDPEGPF